MSKKGLQILFAYDFIIGVVLIVLSFVLLLALVNANITNSQKNIDLPRDSYFALQQLRTFVATSLFFQGETKLVYEWLEYYVTLDFEKSLMYKELSMHSSSKELLESEYARLTTLQNQLKNELIILAKEAFNHDSLGLESKLFLAKNNVIDVELFTPLELTFTTKTQDVNKDSSKVLVFIQIPIFLETISEEVETYTLYLSLGETTSEVITTLKTPVDTLFVKDIASAITPYALEGGVVL